MLRSKAHRHSLALAGVVLALASSGEVTSGEVAQAAEPESSRATFTPEAVSSDDHVDELPPEVRDIRIDEKVGQNLPLDLALWNSDGKQVHLRDYFDGDLPVILTFNYSSCPMLCSAQLNALSETVKKIQFNVGRQYRIVTISFDPRETPASASTMKAKYIEGFDADKRDEARAGWAFLGGDENTIRAAADAAGVRYRYLEKTKEYVHPASLIFVSPKGTITRYYHGIYYEPNELGQSIFAAGTGEEGGSIGFLLACFQLGQHGEYGKMGARIMRYGVFGFLIVMFGVLAVAFSGRFRNRASRMQPEDGRSSKE